MSESDMRSCPAMMLDFSRELQKAGGATGMTVSFTRCPYVNKRVVEAVCRAMGREIAP